MQRRNRGDEGFSLVELVVAIAILGLVLAFTAGGVTGALGLTRTSRARTVAANLATAEMERERSRPFAEHVEGSGAPRQVSVNGVVYDVAVTKQWATQESTSGGCDVATSGSGPEVAYMAIEVQVVNPLGDVPPVTSRTAITPPASQYSPYTGHVVVKVIDRDGAPAVQQVQLLNGPDNPAPKTTGHDGCAVFPLLQPGQYTVNVAASGHVSSRFTMGQFVQAVSEPVEVLVQQTQNVVIEYDEAGILDLRLEGRAGGAPPDAPVPVTIRHDRLPQPGTVTQPVTGGLTMTVFPFADGYEFWAGVADCADHRPDPPTSLVAEPGAPAVPQQLLASLRVRVVDAAGIPVRNTSGTLRASSTTCAAVAYDVTTSTDAQGDALVALPYGTFTLSAVGTTSDTPTVQLTATGTQPFSAVLQVGS